MSSSNNRYINIKNQAEPKRCNRKICSKNCGGVSMKWDYNTVGGDNFFSTNLIHKPSPKHHIKMNGE
jgi:hypothetical protein